MKIRGNESDAKSPFLASYYLIALPIAQVIALNLEKISAEKTNFLTITSSSITIVNFTTEL